MVDANRSQWLRQLDERHDDLARQLDDLNARVEQALAHNGAAPVSDAKATGAPAPESLRSLKLARS